jgi:hypothetical protein
MKTIVLMVNDCVIGVYSTEEKAMAAQRAYSEARKSSQYYWRLYFHTHEFVLDAPC